MKQVLLVDASPMFREFFKEKLTAEKVNVDIASGRRDAYTKLVSNLPDLVIIDVEDDIDNLIDFLQNKQNDPNAKTIPIIVCGPIIPRDRVASLAQYGVVKYFNKPIKFDVFFESVGKILRTSFTIDLTPCVLEIHINGNIIFIEIAQGMNREKMTLLKYKLPELIDVNNLNNPKIILMMTDLQLNFVDGANLELLLDNVTSDKRIPKSNIKILSLDNFTRELIDGHPEYNGIEVTNNLNQVLNKLLDNSGGSDLQDLVTSKILNLDDKADQGSVEMRFMSDTGSVNTDEEGSVLQVAIVDDDAVARKMLEDTYAKIGAETFCFTNGPDFLQAVDSQKFDIVVLDILMPGMNGFDVLNQLRAKRFSSPIIVYSQMIQREAVVQSLTLGAKSYLIKPQRPEAIINKTMEIIHAGL